MSDFAVLGNAPRTLVSRSWRFRCTDTTPTVRFYCVCIALSIRSSWLTCAQSTTMACLLRLLYDWDVLATLVIRLWRSALSKRHELPDSFIPLLVIRCHVSTYLAMLQQSRLPSPKKTSYSRSRKQREDRDVKDSGSELCWHERGCSSDTMSS